jgi:hypothetical protein
MLVFVAGRAGQLAIVEQEHGPELLVSSSDGEYVTF